MDRNRLILAIIFLLAIASTFIGIINISLYSTASKFSKQSGSTFFGESGPGAALVRINGEIHAGKSGMDSTGSESVLAQLEEIQNSRAIKGVLLEINSPGGSAAASQEIFNAVMELKKTKKVVVSMKDVAASGGYYIAAAADSIFAQHSTLTGSIGVIAVVPNLSGFLNQHGVKIKTYKAGKFKDILSMFRDSSQEEEMLIQKMLGDTYHKFIEDVARGRNRTVASIEELAQGRIYSGEDAFRNKLVDELGGRKEAMRKLAELCQFEGEMPLYEHEDNPMDKLFKMLGASTNQISLVSAHNPVMLILPHSLRLTTEQLLQSR